MRACYPYIASLLGFGVAWCFLHRHIPQESFNSVYDQKLQLAGFTAFLTVGSFLLAMKAFILVRLREDIYKHDAYKQRYLRQNKTSYNGDYYRGLVQLGYLLVISVVASFTASIAQVTVGFSENYTIKLLAPASGVAVLVLVFFDWLIVFLNIRDWFAFIEAEAKEGLSNNRS